MRKPDPAEVLREIRRIRAKYALLQAEWEMQRRNDLLVSAAVGQDKNARLN